MSTPHKCPICLGVGLVAKGFYNSITTGTFIIPTTQEPCRTCAGKGIVWEPEEKITCMESAMHPELLEKLLKAATGEREQDEAEEVGDADKETKHLFFHFKDFASDKENPKFQIIDRSLDCYAGEIRKCVHTNKLSAFFLEEVAWHHDCLKEVVGFLHKLKG